MKLMRFLYQNRARYGVLEGETVRSLATGPFDGGWNPTAPEYDGGAYALSAVKVLVPCEPTKYLVVGMNYYDLAASVGAPVPESPIILTRPGTSVIADGEDIIVPRMACGIKEGRGMQFEAEVGVVIGRRCKHARAENAADYILGYTCTNDLAFDGAFGKDFTLCKGADTFGPTGPFIETEFDPHSARIRSWVNGELRQNGSSDQMIFKVPALIEYISSYLTLFPGDVIATGTPAGNRRFIEGDRIKIEIDGLGALENGSVADEW